MEGKFVVLVAAVCVVYCVSIVDSRNALGDEITDHRIERRFINPSLSIGAGFSDSRVSRIRTKRSEEECEKLGLCKLHARAQRNFIAAFQLYFVNKENARLWDHQPHSMSECYRTYSCYR
ncbi:uncharacterized protein LOC119829424 [Zerene cesonia]|uniref:uncharacterized protein LOC119829424 n=1 Tax=Zerene cesonia TaxID=33412 RepID=UPI0018E576A4|nr:uncharacterized protein LOC119829424 [Zerene cesonia]